MEEKERMVSQELLRWEAIIQDCRLPEFDSLPGIGLYMDQVILLLNEYLSYLVYEGGEEKLVTPAMVNNYVKMRLLPPPQRKKYGRTQLAYLIMISILKQTLSIKQVKKLLPRGDEATVRLCYDDFVAAYGELSRSVCGQIRALAAPLLDAEDHAPSQAGSLALRAAVAADIMKLFTGKLIALLPETEKEKK